jgi:sulfonate transport system ATP-binding protein
VAVVGRSGGGKSTLLRLLAGLENPTLASCWRARRRWRKSRTIPDDVPGCAPAAVENGDRQRRALERQWRDAALQALASVGLEDRAGEWPAALSGGQKQRGAGPRADSSPGLLLLDEPLGALDALTRLEMQDLIVSLWQEHGFTVLLVTHDVSEAVAMADGCC